MVQGDQYGPGRKHDYTGGGFEEIIPSKREIQEEKANDPNQNFLFPRIIATGIMKISVSQRREDFHG